MLDFLLFNKAGQYLRTISPLSVHCELLHNAVSFAELTFDDDDTSDMTPGTRIRVQVAGNAEIEGPITGWRGTGPTGSTVITVEDDFRLFRGLGWPNPDRPINSQTSEYKRYSGPTETVVKAACADLSTRLGLGWTVPTSTALGSTQRVEFRFHPLIDKLASLVTADDLTWTLRAGVVDVTQSSLYPTPLRMNSGVIGDYRWSRTLAEATRVVVGGEGEGTARVLQQFVDTARETDLGMILDVFKDSRMAQGVTDLSPDGAAALAEGAGKVTLSADLIETDWFRFPTAYKVGDRLNVQIDDLNVTERITQIVIDDTPDDGLKIAPHLGEIEDDGDSRLATQIARLNASVRDQRSSR